MILKLCKICKKAMLVKPSMIKRGRGKFCSLACSAKSNPALSRPMGKELNPNWKGGVSETNLIKKRYREKNPEKHSAHLQLSRAIKNKTLLRKPCEICGELKVDGHHEDYSKPLEVIWLCRKHHIEAHKGRFGSPASPKVSLMMKGKDDEGRIYKQIF